MNIQIILSSVVAIDEEGGRSIDRHMPKRVKVKLADTKSSDEGIKEGGQEAEGWCTFGSSVHSQSVNCSYIKVH